MAGIKIKMGFLKWYFLDNLKFWHRFSTRLLILLYDALGVDAVISRFFAPYRKDKTVVGYGVGIFIRTFWLIASAVMLMVMSVVLAVVFAGYYLIPLALLKQGWEMLLALGFWIAVAFLLYRYSQSDRIDNKAVEEEIKLRLEGSDDPNDVETVRAWVLGRERRKFRWMFWHDEFFKRRRGINLGWVAGFLPEVKSYSRDLTRDYAEGKLPRVYGRNYMLDKIVEIINRSINNNILLVGEAGVGKRALVYKLIEEERTGGKRVIELNIAGMMAGTRGRGDLEERLQETLRELRTGEVIVFIPEVQGAVKADLADYLSPTLGNERFPVIATTTPAAFKNVIEPQSSFVATFETRRVAEPSISETLAILLGVANRLEGEKKVVFTYPAIKAAVELSERYIHDLAQPEKSIRVIDTAAAATASTQITTTTIADVVAEKTGIPVGEVNTAEANRLLNLERLLHRRIVGQDEAVKAIAKAMRRARSGVKTTECPIASLLFVGPTGVGKTLTAKTLAGVYFAPPDTDSNIGHRMSGKGLVAAFLRFDMSEFSERGAVGNFIGRLTDAVRNRPYALILLDEFEKAEPEIHNLFLQIMEDGRLSDSSGRVVDFRSTIIVVTSNAITLVGTQLAVPSRLELEKHFRPELLNRFDGIVLFRPLSPRQMRKVARRELQQLKSRLGKKKIELSWSNELTEELARLGYDEEFGARPLKRIIQDRLEDRLATKLLRQELSPGDTYHLTVSDLV